MKKEKLTFLPMDFDKDKAEIASWEAMYAGTPGYEAIDKFIIDKKDKGGLGAVIENNHETHSIGDDEKKYAFVAKNASNQIVGWIMLDIFDISKGDPQMLVQYLVVSPEFQGQGYGTEIAKEILLNPEFYTGIKPTNIFCYVDVSNANSLLLFSKFNFSFMPLRNCNYFQASTQNAKLLDSPFENIVFGEPDSNFESSTFGE